MPDIGEGLTEADITEWYVAVGDEVVIDQAIVEIETAKTTVEITATHAGTLLALGGAPGDSVAVGDVLFVIGEEGSQSEDSSQSEESSQLTVDSSQEEGSQQQRESSQSEDSSQFTVHSSQLEEEGPRTTVHGRRSESGERKTENGERPKAMPIVRKLAKERGIDLATITGTGPGGSITREDVENASKDESTVELIAMSRKRRAIAHHMSESWATIPHVTVQADIRAEHLLSVREGSGPEPVPVEAVVTQAVLPLLARHREFNAAVRDDSIEYRDGYHIGIAVDTTNGLMVVVVRDADTYTLEELAREIRRLAHAAHDGALLPGEAVGQTFTISNIGALGGGHGTPIIPMGTSGILSIGRAHSTPVVENGTLAVGMVAPIDLSYDHRLIDGGLGQRFLSELVENLETGRSSNIEGTP